MPATALIRRAYHRPDRPTNVRSGRNTHLEGTITPAAVTPSGAGPTDLGSIAATWLGERPTRLESLGSGGLSGAPVVRVGRADGCDVVLKRVAGDTAATGRAAWVHTLIHRARSHGVRELAAPLFTPAGATLVADTGGGVWELVPFMAGRPLERPSTVEVARAMDVLACLHEAWSSDAGDGGPPRASAPPSSVVRRIEQARTLARLPWSLRRDRCLPLLSAITGGADAIAPLVADVMETWERAIVMFTALDGTRIVRRVAGMKPAPLLLQPVLRDIWFDHVLFEGRPPGGPGSDRHTRVAAVIDLHGAGVDSPATDIARLAGSWWSPDLGVACDAWLAAAVDRYSARRALGAGERALVPWLHAVGVICALDNWFRWVVEERRVFADAPRVRARLARLVEALPGALAWLAVDSAASRV